MDDRDYFWRMVNTPSYWQDAARDFVCAANLLKKDYYAQPRLGFARRGRLSPYAAARQRHTSSRAIVVLYAFAIENLLKAIVVAMGKDPIDARGELRRWFATHDLNKLARHADLTGLDSQRLDQLTAFIKSGKYPVGLSDGDGPRARSHFPDSVIVAIEQMLPVLEDRLQSIPARRDTLPRVDLLKLCAGRGRRSESGGGRKGTTVHSRESGQRHANALQLMASPGRTMDAAPRARRSASTGARQVTAVFCGPASEEMAGERGSRMIASNRHV